MPNDLCSWISWKNSSPLGMFWKVQARPMLARIIRAISQCSTMATVEYRDRGE